MAPPNPQAVEAVQKWVVEPRHKHEGGCVDCGREAHDLVEEAEPHIRSQVLTELANYFKGRESITQRAADHAGKRGEMDAQAHERGRSTGFGAAASYCRNLVAQESDNA